MRVMVLVLPFDKELLIGFTQILRDDTRHPKIGVMIVETFSTRTKAVPSR